ncbi:MAG TPA: hypothetical protein VHB30_11975 [Solirubrobacteraceae bacterium]|nr:hypothetical protein [Solirubrobacteraceae bacterium]
MEVTEVTMVTGERLRAEGTPEQIEATITAAARGALMQLAWLADVDTGRPVAVNPEHVVSVRAADVPETGVRG